MSSAPPAAEELLWRQYALYTEIYKTYISATIQLSVFVYAVTGGMVSYFLVNSGVPALRWALLFPTIFNAGITLLYYGGLPLLAEQERQTMDIARRLGLTGIVSYFVVRVFLGLFASLHLLTTVGLIILMSFGWTIPTH